MQWSQNNNTNNTFTTSDYWKQLLLLLSIVDCYLLLSLFSKCSPHSPTPFWLYYIVIGHKAIRILDFLLSNAHLVCLLWVIICLVLTSSPYVDVFLIIFIVSSFILVESCGGGGVYGNNISSVVGNDFSVPFILGK